MRNRRHFFEAFAQAAALVLGASRSMASLAQGHSATKMAKFVVGFPAGGATDVLARALADKLKLHYPTGLMVETRAGAASRLAAEYVKASAPDALTLLFTVDFALTIFPHSFKALSYDPIQDFTPVVMCSKSALVLCVGPMVPDKVQSLADFLGWCKAHPEQAAYASTSAGASPHFAGLLLSKATQIPLLHVPYKGGAPALQDLMGGQIASSFNPLGEVIPHLKSARLRPLAITAQARSRFLPQTPTLFELGYKDLVIESWLGVLCPKNTPSALVHQTAAWINEALNNEGMKEALDKMGMVPVQSTPEQFAKVIKADLEMWGPVIKASGFTAEET